MIAIIDYGMGNLASVQKALTFLKLPNIITNDHSEIRSARQIILPGVGSFAKAMENLKSAGLVDVLNEEVVVKKKKFLGICLGMQLLATTGTEPYKCEGLGWIEGEVVKLSDNNIRIPHLGWNNIKYSDDSVFKTISDFDFYFIHSYHFKAKNPADIIATTNYGQDLVAGLRKNNIAAFQFHPEKSQTSGLSLLKNYLEY